MLEAKDLQRKRECRELWRRSKRKERRCRSQEEIERLACVKYKPAKKEPVTVVDLDATEKPKPW